MQRMFRFMCALALMVALLGAMAHPAAAAPARGVATTWTVLVGAETGIEQTEYGPAGAWQLMKFYPNKLTINAGDSIVFKINSAEIHNVLFLGAGAKLPAMSIPDPSNPQSMIENPAVIYPQGGMSYDGTATVGSGIMGRAPTFAQQYTLTFPTAGSFTYVCSIHSGQLPNGQLVGMMGALTVQAAGAAYPQTPAQVDAAAQAAMSADAAATVTHDAEAHAVTTRPGANGSTIYTLNMGYGTDIAEYMRFSVPDLSIHEGDTVEWMHMGMAPHNVLFASGDKEPDFTLVQPQPGGPPKLVMNPVVAAPAGGQTYNGSGLFNSGLLFGEGDGPPNAPHTYALTFTKAGHYEYICSVHDEEGMRAFITVLAAGSTPGMPTTGHGADGLGAALALVAALALAVLGLGLRRRARAAL
jgi:plastocyanin